ncbi:MAG TPA: hypothetical protein VLA00_13455 [Xanthobacteraceae bacterium]|nr:hypothetical protein [Xanthobacteraceae bacterium]
MPPVFIVALGSIGIAALAKLLARESRRVNGELDQSRRSREADYVATPRPTLERDPRTGEFRPRRT